MRRFIVLVAAAVLGSLAAAGPASAEIVAQISISQQSMTVIVDGVVRHTWPVSTARKGFITPKGTFKVQSMHVMTYSRLFNNAPMPFSIFYDGHYAIHGTLDVKRLGQPASAGCVRLHPDNAKILFEIVKERGPDSLRVVVES
jgi:lipoprotein-anchoring transpeptidase ErfK/SrfK